MPRKRVNHNKRKKSPQFILLLKKISLFFLIISLIGLLIFIYKDNLAYYFSFKSPHQAFHSERDTQKRINKIIDLHPNKIYGIDVSEYQGKIKWVDLKMIDSTHQVDFVLVRATAGKNRVDKKFIKNFEAVKNKNIIRGAYHYYRPNENSIKQAQLFINTVKLSSGDLPPVLDIENIPKRQSMDSLKVGLKRWLNAVEKHFKVKPIIYTGENYYYSFLKNDFEDYHFWIANYSKIIPELDDNWRFWQFTESAKIDGINHAVDVNIFNGNKSQLKKLLID